MSKTISLEANCAGIKSPNPFWLASAPPTNSGIQVMRAFEQGWGGAVWKTLGQDPPVINVSSRYGAIQIGAARMAGFNNIELITDRPLEDNLKEIKEVKKRFPKNAVVVSLMVPCDRRSWQEIVRRVEDTLCDGLELNFGCPHGMSERGMGAAVGQVPDYVRMIVEWVKEVARIPVLVKLTPNVADIRYSARAAKKGGADGVSLINTINSIMGVDLKTLKPKFSVDGKIAHGGYCGPAVKPIALHMVSSITTDPQCQGLPISGIGGISTWSDAVEFMLLGASNVQVCTAVMHHGFKIVEDMIGGLTKWMGEHGLTKLDDFVGKTLTHIVEWKKLNLHYKTVACINPERCIRCQLCHTACKDGSHQAIELSREDGTGNGDGQEMGTVPIRGQSPFPVPISQGVRDRPLPRVIEDNCVGCNLCSIVCPVEGCVTMIPVDTSVPELTWEKYVSGGMKGYRELYKR